MACSSFICHLNSDGGGGAGGVLFIETVSPYILPLVFYLSVLRVPVTLTSIIGPVFESLHEAVEGIKNKLEVLCLIDWNIHKDI